MVSRIVAWSLLGLVVVILLGTWIVNAGPAKTISTNESPTSDLGRFQAVRTSPDQIILLDTTTGALYKAGPDDIKEYKTLTNDGDKDDDSDDSE